jgi:hypothetical protein
MWATPRPPRAETGPPPPPRARSARAEITDPFPLEGTWPAPIQAGEGSEVPKDQGLGRIVAQSR